MFILHFEVDSLCSFSSYLSLKQTSVYKLSLCDIMHVKKRVDSENIDREAF